MHTGTPKKGQFSSSSLWRRCWRSLPVATTITFGPGSVAESHCADERVEIAQVSKAATVIASVAESMFNLERQGETT